MRTASVNDQHSIEKKKILKGIEFQLNHDLRNRAPNNRINVIFGEITRLDESEMASSGGCGRSNVLLFTEKMFSSFLVRTKLATFWYGTSHDVSITSTGSEMNSKHPHFEFC